MILVNFYGQWDIQKGPLFVLWPRRVVWSPQVRRQNRRQTLEEHGDGFVILTVDLGLLSSFQL